MHGKYRITLDDEAIQWITTSLRSASQAGHQSVSRKQYLIDLADRLGEHRQGNPHLIFKGRLTREEA